MKKWWLWFVLSAIWILAAFLNVRDERSTLVIVYNIASATLLAGMGLAQMICDKKGEKGQRIMKFIYVIVVIALLIALGMILLAAF